MADIPVWDQADTSICYAITAADLVDSYRFSHTNKNTPHKFTSPMASAILGCSGEDCNDPIVRGSDGYDYLPFEGGGACAVINQLRGKSTCSRDAFQKYFGPEVESSMQKISSQYARFQSSMDDSTAQTIACELNQQAFSLPLQGSLQAIKTALGGNIWGYFKYLTTLACGGEGNISLSVPSCREVLTSDPQRLLQAIHAHFDKNLDRGQPMEVSYCSDVFMKGKSFAGIIKNNGTKPLVKTELCEGNDPNFPSDEGGHSSLLIGRRFNAKTQKCQLLIKNSWGKDMSGISKDWDTEEGKIWIDEDAFARNIISFSFLDKDLPKK